MIACVGKRALALFPIYVNGDVVRVTPGTNSGL